MLERVCVIGKGSQGFHSIEWKKPILFEWMSLSNMNELQMLQVLLVTLLFTTQGVESFLVVQRDQLVSPLPACHKPILHTKKENEHSGNKSSDQRTEAAMSMSMTVSPKNSSQKSRLKWLKTYHYLLLYIVLWNIVNLCVLPLYVVVGCIVTTAAVNIALSVRFVKTVYHSYLLTLTQSKVYLWEEMLATEMSPIRKVGRGSVVVSLASTITFLVYFLFVYDCKYSFIHSSTANCLCNNEDNCEALNWGKREREKKREKERKKKGVF
ncbi:hypothetical protein RFI_26238, partial [Reticulomyxa filosa]